MWNNPVLSLVVLAPLAQIGRGALVGITYLGALGTLVGSAIRSLFRPSGECPAFVPATTRQVATLLAMGLPLVGLVHVGLGSFLSMQAYFGGTFVDGTGAVVGVGLIRNAAPLMAGLTLAVLIAARTVWELRGRPRPGLDAEPGWVADRDPAPGRPAVADPCPSRPGWPPSGSPRRWWSGRCWRSGGSWSVRSLAGRSAKRCWASRLTRSSSC